jgi:pantoate--beta-alanine ligase
MLVLHKIKEIQEIIASEKQKGRTIGFVPTMGALHRGHISLIQISKQQTDITVCSIFVNPTQFNNASDLTHYPRTPEADIRLLEEAGCDILYMPDVNDVYPENDERKFDFGYLDTVLEGAHRKGHFNGVGQVVSILLEGVNPNKAFFGSKDYQQVMVVKELVKQMHLSVDIVPCPILREADGLAMSSRNTRLSAEQRKTAALVPKLMTEAREIALQNDLAAAKAFVTDRISEQPTMKLDYYEICDAESLKAIAHISEARQAVSLIAVFVGNIRLIDNWMIN